MLFCWSYCNALDLVLSSVRCFKVRSFIRLFILSLVDVDILCLQQFGFYSLEHNSTLF